MAALALALVAGGSAAQAQVGYGGSGGGTVVGGSGGGTGGTVSTSCFIQVNTPPEGFSVKVNDGTQTVSSRQVDLHLNGGDAVRMAISNDASFDNISSEYYTSSKSWNLPAGEGRKTIYVRFYNSCGASTPVISTSVTLTNAKVPANPGSNGNGNGNSGSTGGQVLGEKITLVDELIARTAYGRRSDDARALQAELARLGFMPRDWSVTNYYGPITLRAVNRYSATKPGDLDTLIASVRYGQVSPNVLRVQTALTKAGFMPRGWRSTSFFGPVTRAGVAKYQASK